MNNITRAQAKRAQAKRQREIIRDDMTPEAQRLFAETQQEFRAEIARLRWYIKYALDAPDLLSTRVILRDNLAGVNNAFHPRVRRRVQRRLARIARRQKGTA